MNGIPTPQQEAIIPTASPIELLLMLLGGGIPSLSRFAAKEAFHPSMIKGLISKPAMNRVLPQAKMPSEMSPDELMRLHDFMRAMQPRPNYLGMGGPK